MRSRTRGYFEGVYARSDDPWSSRTSDYEREKYDRTLEALARRRYERALEIGCSVGVLTRRLAEHAGHLVAIDISERAIELARATCRHRSNVTFVRCDATCNYPPGRFDLVVLSEVAYYWSDDDFARTRERIAESLGPDGDVLLVDFLPEGQTGAWGGDAVHDAFLHDRRFRGVRGVRAEGYRIDLLRVVVKP
ncbi:MAG: class I SAM-dependent methyltransferase [Candidatus Eremiobacteraeota bacterium]|nr:class I SAM-dependent methyltransferase [Candidatus Eremiobacteraeota bacterium]MBC5802630.1 class I SAM-dependent methyltransferase [Candidatus Eremiobacteraeota bacterium]MBC5820968.1 class I SAM-dependent methyltransferase [Candidatus Eremiobacteraeota bacterium]